MKTRVARLELIKHIKQNRDQHKGIFDEAVVGYKKQAVALLDEHIARINKGRVMAVSVHLTVPENHTKDYDRVLMQLEMSHETDIELNDVDAKCFLMDDWEWKRQFLTANSTYSKRAEDALTHYQES